MIELTDGNEEFAPPVHGPDLDPQPRGLRAADVLAVHGRASSRSRGCRLTCLEPYKRGPLSRTHRPHKPTQSGLLALATIGVHQVGLEGNT
ncbi:hypothetical protein GCM10017674_74570 [Streptomyces gardneri]|uniref:Uncharacterized protein n=1 Tax=Streptomyces gardneri TaxID=66892 RepID=A0A4Y3RRU2_9ACTN|nr:hypothetical protein SGA01_56290 [Streptomyces gardneri]GHH20623.1 hypothetical protein GCM10017674_74570 [Streptomyces gardneri]